MTRYTLHLESEAMSAQCRNICMVNASKSTSARLKEQNFKKGMLRNIEKTASYSQFKNIYMLLTGFSSVRTVMSGSL